MSAPVSAVSSLSKLDAIRELIPFIEQSHAKQGFNFAETAALQRAMQYFTTDGEKPVVDEKAQDQELAAVNLLFQAVHVGNHRGAYNITQSATIYELLVHIKKLYESPEASASSSSGESSSKKLKGKASRSAQLEDVEEEASEDHSEEEEEYVPPATSIRKGKSKA